MSFVILDSSLSSAKTLSANRCVLGQFINIGLFMHLQIHISDPVSPVLKQIYSKKSDSYSSNTYLPQEVTLLPFQVRYINNLEKTSYYLQKSTL